jgi:excisionase family DNA binding protein
MEESVRFAYGISEACLVSCVGRTTLYAAIKSGDLRARKVGRRTLVTADDLRDWLNSRPTTHEGRAPSAKAPPKGDGS